jgi:hypothetical protein
MEVKGNQPKLQRAVFDKVLPLFKEAPHDIMEDDSHGRRADMVGRRTAGSYEYLQCRYQPNTPEGDK